MFFASVIINFVSAFRGEAHADAGAVVAVASPEQTK